MSNQRRGAVTIALNFMPYPLEAEVLSALARQGARVYHAPTHYALGEHADLAVEVNDFCLQAAERARQSFGVRDGDKTQMVIFPPMQPHAAVWTMQTFPLARVARVLKGADGRYTILQIT